MLTKQEKSEFRSTLFCHLDGLATATTAYGLHKKGVLDYLLKNNSVTLNKLSKAFNANEGYLNVALRVLCSQGWLTQIHEGESVYFKTNTNSKRAFELVPLFEDAVNLLKYSVQFPEVRSGADAFTSLDQIFNNISKA